MATTTTTAGASSGVGGMESSTTSSSPHLMHSPLSQLPLKPSTLAILTRHGFTSVRDVRESHQGGIGNLACELECSTAMALAIKREVDSALLRVDGASLRGGGAGMGVSAARLLQQEQQQHRGIVTFCRAMDMLLGNGGGVPLGEVTEVVGEPGVGKTQLAMQLAVNVSLPPDFGGLAGEAIYIDTEGSFSPHRCWHMATALVAHIQGVHARRQKRHATETPSAAPSPPIPGWFTVENILNRIHVFRIYDEAAQMATLQSLSEFIAQRKQQQQQQQQQQEENNENDDDSGRGNIKLVVVDSIAFHFRGHASLELLLQSMTTPGNTPNNNGGGNYKDPDSLESLRMSRMRSLLLAASLLQDLAHTHHLAVVAMNHVTTRVGENEPKMIPALGESWSHAATGRVILSMSPNSKNGRPVRLCRLVKSPHRPPGQAEYVVTPKGIRGIDNC